MLAILSEQLEALHRDLQELEEKLTKTSNEMLEAENAVVFIKTIAEYEIQNSTIRGKILDIHNKLHHLRKNRMLTAGETYDVDMLLEDCNQLDATTEFYSDRISFLMTSIMGFIGIKQNKIIQVFSVASVALLPPTLVASVYSMNLPFPEILALGAYAYPYTVAVMVLSAVVPMFIFWRKGWLK